MSNSAVTIWNSLACTGKDLQRKEESIQWQNGRESEKSNDPAPSLLENQWHISAKVLTNESQGIGIGPGLVLSERRWDHPTFPVQL